MIRIACTNCKTVLTIDDAFAGGVCRCQYCGTIQTVPAHLKESATVGTTGQAMGGMKTSFQNDARSGTGLDDLAGAVLSSGLDSSHLRKQIKPARQPKANLLPIFIGGGLVIAVLLGVIIFLVAHGSGSGPSPGAGGVGSTGSTAGTAGAGTPGQTVDANTPNFCAAPIEGSTVVYLLDSGSGMTDYLGDVKDAAEKSIETLGSERKFQILFWNNGSDQAYPENSTTYATKENAQAAASAMQDIPAFGQSNVKPSIKLALKQHPDTLVIATNKGWDLDNNWVKDILTIRGNSPVRIDCFNIGDSDSAPLKSLASKTGGSYRNLGRADLRGN